MPDDVVSAKMLRALSLAIWSTASASSTVAGSLRRRRPRAPPRRRRCDQRARSRRSRSAASRKASTAISLAAFSTVGRPPPALQRVHREPQRREALEVRRARRSACRSPPDRARRRRVSMPVGLAEAMGDGHAHVGSGQAGGHRAVGERHEPVDDGLRMHQHVEPLGRRCRTCDAPRSVRGPCSSGSAESIVTFGPIDQLGWASACSGVAAAIALGASRSGTGRPRRSASSSRSRDRSAAERLEDGVVLAVERQQRGAGRGGGRMNGAPAQTRHSLLASATVRPAASAAWVGSTPAVPAMAPITRSAGRRPPRRRPRAGGGLDAGAGQRGLQAGIACRVGDRGEAGAEPHRRSAPAPRRRGRRRPLDRNGPGCARQDHRPSSGRSSPSRRGSRARAARAVAGGTCP